MIKNGTGFVKGNLAQDATVIVLESGKSMTTLTVMKNRSKLDEKTKEWVNIEPQAFDIITFDTLANRAANLKKGTRVSVHFDMAPTHYTSVDDKKIKTWSLIGSDIEKNELLPKASILSKIQANDEVSF
jgi:single-stranded DNA-binding protein